MLKTIFFIFLKDTVTLKGNKVTYFFIVTFTGRQGQRKWDPDRNLPPFTETKRGTQRGNCDSTKVYRKLVIVSISSIQQL